MDIAIIQDELVRMGGAERVVLLMKKAFPKAPIYTLAFNKKLTYPEFSNFNVIQTWFGVLARNEKWLKRLFFPLGIWAMRSLDLRQYDVVLISSTHVGKYISVSDSCLVFNYCHTPFRLAWLSDSYSEYSGSYGLKRKLIDLLIKQLRRIDYKYAQRTDYFLTNSLVSKSRIESIYKPDIAIKIINPPVNLDQFYISAANHHFLLVSRLENYKKAELVITTFNELGLPLVVIGKGSQKEKLVMIANSDITFISNVSQKELSKYYSNSKALVFPQYEDYGITPLEANASGIPVIAFGEGGVKETMIPFEIESKKSTAVFFSEQTQESLSEAVRLFENLDFEPEFIRNHAKKFNEGKFIKDLKNYITSKLKV